MKIAKEVTRQRLLIEGYYNIGVDKKIINNYFNGIIEHLNLKIYGRPIIFSPGGQGKEINQGYDAFVPLIDSGISLYVWANAKFFSVIIYTCKSFNEKEAINFTREFFKSSKFIKKSF